MYSGKEKSYFIRTHIIIFFVHFLFLQRLTFILRGANEAQRNERPSPRCCSAILIRRFLAVSHQTKCPHGLRLRETSNQEEALNKAKSLDTTL